MIVSVSAPLSDPPCTYRVLVGVTSAVAAAAVAGVVFSRLVKVSAPTGLLSAGILLLAGSVGKGLITSADVSAIAVLVTAWTVPVAALSSGVWLVLDLALFLRFFFLGTHEHGHPCSCAHLLIKTQVTVVMQNRCQHIERRSIE